jgi:hypothetical protein
MILLVLAVIEVMLSPDFESNALISSPTERRLAAQQHVGYHTYAPHVTGIAIAPFQHLQRTLQ